MSHPTTLITGAALRVGAGIAEHLAGRGHSLVLHYRRSNAAAEALGARLTADYGVEVALVGADFEQPEALARFWEGLPPVTHLVHSAGLFVRDGFANFTAAQLRAHLAVNFEAPLLLSQGFLAQLPEGARGTITVLGDGSKGWSLSPEFFSYAASKCGWEPVIGLLATACAPRVRANMLALGPTLEGPTDPEGFYARMAERTPLKHTSSVASVRQGVDFLLAAEDVTGQVISLAGGVGLPTLRPS